MQYLLTDWLCRFSGWRVKLGC